MQDVVVVGGSVAGAALAGSLARAGLRVTVLDRAQFPRAKACGEGLLPPGVAVLRRLGVSLPNAAAVHGIRFQVGDVSAWLPFPAGEGLAVSRLVLDEAIRSRAASLGVKFVHARALGVIPGSRGVTGRVETDQGDFSAPVLVGADGVRSVFHRSLGLRVRVDARRIGFSTHWEGAGAEAGVVEVTAFPGGELYVANLGGTDQARGCGTVLAALLVDRKLGLGPGSVEGFLRERFSSRFGGARVVGSVLGAYPLASRVDRPAGPGWLLVGDAAGAVDPISGEGMSLALCGSELAADVVGRALELKGEGIEGAFKSYAVRLRALRRPVERLTGGMLFLSRHPRVASRVLGREERLRPLMGVATGEPGVLSRIAGI